jgi:hypothetical protein
MGIAIDLAANPATIQKASIGFIFHHSPPYAAPKWVGKRIGNLGQLLSTPHEAIIG